MPPKFIPSPWEVDSYWGPSYGSSTSKLSASDSSGSKVLSGVDPSSSSTSQVVSMAAIHLGLFSLGVWWLGQSNVCPSFPHLLQSRTDLWSVFPRCFWGFFSSLLLLLRFHTFLARISFCMVCRFFMTCGHSV